ncbi:hypothetical protein [Anaerobaca lacustris]|uniref:ATP-binding protein n=1 Tax=Anaerobaca lacustris TaxID=3044600 RepID=A0AAW6TWN3_9BACT|nr:hypothetical protein [Sedimentisphaerales bacterium M17dextr]
MSDGRNIFVSGQTGSGKTFLVERAIAGSSRCLVYLTKREECGYHGVYFDGLAGERETMLRWWRLANARANRFRIVYRPRDPWSFEEFNAIAGLVYRCGDMDFVCEELGGYVTSSVFRKTDYGQEFKSLLTAGRTRGVRCWLMSQRPKGIPIEVRSEAREAYVFHSQEPADLAYLSDWLGIEVELKMAQLAQYEHVHWQQGGKIEVARWPA